MPHTAAIFLLHRWRAVTNSASDRAAIGTEALARDQLSGCVDINAAGWTQGGFKMLVYLFEFEMTRLPLPGYAVASA